MGGEFLYNNNVVLIIGAICLAAVGYLFYQIKKKFPTLNPGEVMSAMAVDQHETIFIGCIIGIGIADALIVTTAHTQEAVMISPLGRVLLHLSFFLIETAASITLVRDIASCFMKQEWRWRIWKIITTILIFIAVFYVPYLTISIAASNLNADFVFDLWRYSVDPRTSAEEWANIVAEYQLSPDGKPYRAYDPLPNPLKLLMASAGLRFLLLMIEGGRNIASPVRFRMLFEKLEKELKEENTKKDESKDESKKDESKKDESKEKSTTKNLKFLLSRLGYSGPKLDEQVGRAEKAFDMIKDDTDKGHMAARLAQLVSRAEQIKNIADQNEKANKNKELKNDIIKFFSNKAIEPKDKRPANMKDSEYLKNAGLGLLVKGADSPK